MGSAQLTPRQLMQLDFDEWSRSQDPCWGMVRKKLWYRVYTEAYDGAMGMIGVIFINFFMPFTGVYELSALGAWFNYQEPMENMVSMADYAIKYECYGP